MRFVLLLIGGLILANIITATFFMASPDDEAPAPVVNWATKRGLDPWMATEDYSAPGRDHIRKGVLETLDKPWSSFGTPKGHKDLINTVNNYYYQRDAEAWSKVNAYGERARAFAVKVWSTTDDHRIERLIDENLGRGYVSLDELQPYARKPVKVRESTARRSGRSRARADVSAVDNHYCAADCGA
jgi:hypothetical protein